MMSIFDRFTELMHRQAGVQAASQVAHTSVQLYAAQKLHNIITAPKARLGGDTGTMAMPGMSNKLGG